MINWYKISKLSPRKCDDCGNNLAANHEFYMVKNEIWEEAGKENGEGDLCINCLEDRIGRKLNSKDFPKLNKKLQNRINNWVFNIEIISK